jgi:hypothetical protein
MDGKSGEGAERLLRRWARIAEAEGRALRVVLLPDGETIHNALFDRGYKLVPEAKVAFPLKNSLL